LYSPSVSERRIQSLVEQIRKGADPLFKVREHDLWEVDEWVAHLERLHDPEKGLTRALNQAEVRFVTGELALSKAFFPYWLLRYPLIKTKEQTLSRVRLLESQEIILQRVAKEEEEAVEGRSGDGLLFAVLKARQLGASTLAECILAHRAFFYSNTTALVAGDVPEQSAYLFDMIERIYENLPWWMKPERTYAVKDNQLFFGKLDSLVLVGSGKSVRGGADFERGRGQLGRGKTLPLSHLSELSTWENTDQIDDSLMPAIPRHARTLAIFESTARGRGNWWHNAWLLAKKGLGRLKPVFIPWYAETRTYRRPAPLDWEPSQLALAHAKRAKEVSAQWCGRSVELERDQLYWWETTRAEALEKKKLSIFLAEYAADDLEAFQNTSRSVFPSELLHELRQGVQQPPVVCDVRLKSLQAGLSV
jgi:hypothetical protein